MYLYIYKTKNLINQKQSSLSFDIDRQTGKIQKKRKNFKTKTKKSERAAFFKCFCVDLCADTDV